MDPAKVLVVDDERSILLLLKEALTQWGYQVTVASSAADALNLLKSELFDALITDIRMPDMSGLELLKADGEPDDTCLANTIPPGTPIVRHDHKNAALGIEEVSVLDVALQLPCNKDRVWVKSSELDVVTSFPSL